MNINLEKNDGVCRMAIECEMNIFNAAELKSAMFEHLDSLDECSELQVDLAKTGEMDSTGFQLLLLLKREAGRLNKGFRISSHSPASRSVLEMYRMLDYFEQ